MALPEYRPNGPERDERDHPDRGLQVGTGTAIAHHGEFLQGVFEGSDARLHRGLITVPMPTRQAVATFWPRTGTAIRTRPAGLSKALRAAELTLARLGLAHAGGDLTIQSAICVGHGYGSSTADVVASIRAVAAAAGKQLTASSVCAIAVAAEGASDAIAYADQAVLFAQREGRVLEFLAGEFPPLVIVGLRSIGQGPVDTLGQPAARYDSGEIEQFRVLRGLAGHAIAHRDARLLGRVASMSAQISQRHLPKPHFETVRQIAAHHRACGVQVAHSGSLMGVLLDASEPGVAARAAAVADSARRANFAEIQIFQLNADGAVPP